MNYQDIATQSWEESVRIESMYMLSMLGDQVPEGIIEGLTEEEFDIEDLLGVVPEGYAVDDDHEVGPNFYDGDFEEMSDVILSEISNLNRYGLFAKVSTPVVDESGSYSWGHYKSKWIYAETIEELVKTAFNSFNKV